MKYKGEKGEGEEVIKKLVSAERLKFLPFHFYPLISKLYPGVRWRRMDGGTVLRLPNSTDLCS